MNKDKTEKIEVINERIFECKECDFHTELEEKKIAYRPDAPVENFADRDINIITVGINSTWNDNAWSNWEECYKKETYEEYKEYCLERFKEHAKYSKSYARGVKTALNTINEYLNVLPGKELNEDNVFEENVLWQNLSFCNSNSPKDSKRKFGDNYVSCHVYTEEIPKCLEEGYLRDVISIIEPELVVFFATRALDLSEGDYKKTIIDIFDLNNADEIDDFGGIKEFPPFERADKKEVRIRGLACKIISKKTNILILPHPSYPMNSNFRKDMINKLCNKLM
jgi:hypothetical protein